MVIALGTFLGWLAGVAIVAVGSAIARVPRGGRRVLPLLACLGIYLASLLVIAGCGWAGRGRRGG